jgi:hypothetical protein
MRLRARHLAGVLATLVIACGGLATGTSGGGVGGTLGSGSGCTAGGGGGGVGGGGGTAGSPPEDASFHDATHGQDAALPSLDAALASLDASPTGLAGFAFIVNDVVQHPMPCPSEDWEFPVYPEGSGNCGPPPKGCPGVKSVLVVNTGALPMPYIVTSSWNAIGGYVPGVQPGCAPLKCLAGVLDPGRVLDITSVYDMGIVAVLGSSDPFSSPDAGKYVSDEGTIPWPAGVAGSGGAATMYVAEIEVPTVPPSTCQIASKIW